MARETVTVDRRLYLSVDDRVVVQSDPNSKRLWCIPGDEIDWDTARRYGVMPGKAPEAAPVAEEAEGSAALESEAESEDDLEVESEGEAEAAEPFVCDDCDYEAKSAAGLAAHRRTHQG